MRRIKEKIKMRLHASDEYMILEKNEKCENVEM